MLYVVSVLSALCFVLAAWRLARCSGFAFALLLLLAVAVAIAPATFASLRWPRPKMSRWQHGNMETWRLGGLDTQEHQGQGQHDEVYNSMAAILPS